MFDSRTANNLDLLKVFCVGLIFIPLALGFLQCLGDKFKKFIAQLRLHYGAGAEIKTLVTDFHSGLMNLAADTCFSPEKAVGTSSNSGPTSLICVEPRVACTL